MAVVEGSVFQNVANMVDTSSTIGGKIFTSPDTSTNADCSTYLGHACQINVFGSTTTYTGTGTSFFSNFKGKNIASASAATGVQSSVVANAGIGKL